MSGSPDGVFGCVHLAAVFAAGRCCAGRCCAAGVWAEHTTLHMPMPIPPKARIRLIILRLLEIRGADNITFAFGADCRKIGICFDAFQRESSWSSFS